MNTYNFTLRAGCPAENIAEAIRVHGIAHLPGYLNNSLTWLLAQQCRALLDAGEPWITPLDYSLGKSVRVERASIAAVAAYATLHAIYSDDVMREIADEFMADREYLFNYDLYIAHDVEGSHHFAHRLHYDRVPHLKFFIYLTDVDDHAGPLYAVPGSHAFAPQAQAANRRAGLVPSEEETRIVPAEYQSQGIRVHGPAGTLLVFNSDIAHSATHITHGERLVIRSRCIEPRHLNAARNQAPAGGDSGRNGGGVPDRAPRSTPMPCRRACSR